MRKFYLPMYSGLSSRTRRNFGWIAFIALLFISSSSFATHMAGGELTYKWISGTTYAFRATFYRDCAGVSAPPSLVLSYSSASCHVNNKNATLNLVAGTGQEITFPCPSAKTTCSGGTNPGFQKWEYADTVDLKKNCTDWVFSWTSCCRNTAITTIQNPNSDNMYIEATLDNSTAFNGVYPSSPTFSNVPVVVFCAGQQVTYNQGAIDPNGDSLNYSFICPRTDASTCVTYNAPYSPTNPIASSPTAAINSQSGDIVLTPTTIQIGVATVLVKKYHNGVLIGSVLRDMEMLVVNCSNNLPTATGINGTNVFGDTVCAGSNVCFNILSNDADVGQIVTMTWNNGIPGATFNTSGSPYPTGTFCWTPSVADARSTPYTFTVTVKDNNCPTLGVQTYSYSVFVPPIAVATSTTGIACSGSTGSVTAVGSGGIAPYNYVWNPGNHVGATVNGLSAGTYTVTATDSKGCTTTGTITLNPAATLTAVVSDSTEVTCHGGSDGSAVVTPSGGAGNYSHSWSNGQTTDTLTGVTAGTYTDTIRDANDCILLFNVTITEPPVLSATITTEQDASCKGQTNGTLVVTPAGGTPGYTYLWAPVAGTDSTLSNLGAGTYTVTVTDNHGCTVTQTGVITEPGTLVPLITAITVTGGNNISCFGATNGSVSVTVTGGTPSYTYLWSPGGFTTDTVTGLGAGTICLHVTDANGCTADTCVTLTQPDSMIVTFPGFSSYFGGVNISCNGALDGFINTSVTGGTPGYHYTWSPNTGDSTANVTGLGAGTYTVTVVDTNGCTAQQTITLIEPAVLATAESSHSNVGCNGEATGAICLSVTGGTGPFTYVWTPNVSTDSCATGLVAGTYSVDITDMNGCTTSILDSVSQPLVIYPLITAATVNGGMNIACSGDSSATAWVTVTGGTPPYMYTWSNGATTDTAFGLPAGPICVHVVDQNGCSKDACDTITQPEPVAASFDLSSYVGGLNVSCNGATDGFIHLHVAGGTPGYTYTWTPPVSTDSIANGLGAGTYTVIIADTNGCKDSLSFTLTAPQPLADSISAVTTNGGWNVGCNGDTTGSITVFVTGGNEPYSYSWTPPVSTTSTATGLGAGTYIITVTDTNGCSKTDSITLTQPAPLSDSLSAKVYIGGKNISCFGYNDGSITDSVFGGTPPYVFVWNTGDTTQNLNLDSAGTYTVTITDANGCTKMDSITLTQPDSISPNPIITMYGQYNIQCHGGKGCITLNPTGGTAGYTYFWTPSEDSLQMHCDTAGTFHVLITDTNGCVSNRDFTLTQPDSLISATINSNYGGSGTSCNSSCDGIITVTVTGGVLPYTYSWSPNVSTDSMATSLCAGSYTVTVTDSNGCVTTVSTTLTAPPPLTDSLSVSNYSGYNVTCVGNDGYITILVNGGTRPYKYTWVPPVSTDSTADSLSAGTYIITVVDSNGCSITDSVTLTQSTVFTVTDTVSDHNGYGTSCNGICDGFIHVGVSGGAPPYTFHWSNGSTTQNLDSLCPGTYTDTIIDQNGCRTFLTRTITQPPLDTTSFSPATACDSLLLPWGVEVDSSGNYSHIYTNQYGCDSTVTAHVTIHYSSPPTSFTPPAACDSLPLPWGTTADSSGNYMHTYTNSAGCDSIVTAHVTINKSSPPTSFTPPPACDSLPLPWGTTADSSGNYTHTYTNSAGCDSIVTAHVTINKSSPPTSFTPPAACDSLPLPWGTTADSSGNYNHTYTNSAGCDSIVTAHVTINKSSPPTSFTPPPACDSLPLPWGTTADSSGDYKHTYTNGAGCDSIVTAHVTINKSSPPTSFTPPPACDSLPLPWGTTADSSGDYKHTYTNGAGCDSIVTAHVTINKSSPPTSITPPASCDSLPLPWGTTADSSGNYSHTYTNSAGCDSIVTAHVTINKSSPPTSITPPAACDSLVLQWGTTADSSGNYSHTYTNGAGCDSIVTAHVTINKSSPPTSITPAASCDSLKLPWNTTADSSGDYKHTYTNSAGCDSIVTAHVTINKSSTPTSFSIDSCTTATLPWGSKADSSGDYVHTYTNGNGCDSIVTAHVTISNIIRADAGPDGSVCPDSVKFFKLDAASTNPGSEWWISVRPATVIDSLDPKTGVDNLVTGSNIFVWIVTNGPCMSSDTVVIRLRTVEECFDSLEMPNGFTPNLDGHNDDFDIHGIEKYPNNTLKIFNRWGNEVYSADNYKNHQWVGQNNSGEPLPDGTYFAILIIKNTNIQLHGYVDLRR